MLLPAVQKVREAAGELPRGVGGPIIEIVGAVEEDLRSMQPVFLDALAKQEAVDAEFVESMLPAVQAGLDELIDAHESLIPGHGEGVEGRTARLELGGWILDATKLVRFLELYLHLGASPPCEVQGC